MFSPVKAITAGAVVFALGGVLLIAQPFGEQGGSVPGAAVDDEALRPALVTGTITYDEDSGEFTCVKGPSTPCAERPSPDRVTRYVLTDVTGRVEMSDQRLSGSVTFDETIDQHTDAVIPDIEGLDAFFVREEGGAVVEWGTLRIENGDGAWEGRFIETLDATADVIPAGAVNVGVVELVGSDAYDGLSAIVFVGGYDDDDEFVSWNGIIFPGELPPDRE